MEILLWKNFSKKKNSTKRPATSSATKKDVRLKDSTSIESPSFLLKSNEFDYNYVKWRSHYYFVTDIRVITNDLMEISCEEDVLATYKDDIGGYNAFIERSASRFNNMFIDSLVSSQQNIIDTSVQLSPVEGMTKSNGCYMVRLVDGSASGGVASYIVDDLSDLAPLFDKNIYYEDSSAEWYEKAFYSIMNPMDYIISIQWIPFSRSTLSSFGLLGLANEIIIKWWQSGINAYKLIKQFYTISTNVTLPSTYYSDFRKYTNRFTLYKIYLPGVGIYDLSPQDVSLGNLEYVMTIDFYTGDISAKLCVQGDQTKVISNFSANIFQKIQIGSDNPNMSSVIGTGLSTIGMAISGNVIGTSVGLIETINNIISPTPSINGGSSGGVSIKYYNAIIVIAYSFGSGDFATNVAGRPLMKNVTISTLNGFVKCGNASIDIDGLSDEKDKVNNYLNSGFYFE